LLEASEKYKVPIQVNRFGSMFNPFFSEQPVRDFSSALKSNTDQFRVFFWELVRQGLFIPPSQFESWFLCSSLSKSEVKKALRAIDLAVKKVAEHQ
jgi:glutamate-1-semialdehyde 2,1-aminomutase